LLPSPAIAGFVPGATFSFASSNVIFWRGSKPQRNDPSSLARECRLIIKRSAKEYTHIDIEECGYIHFNNGIGFVEKKVWSGEIQRQQQPANQAIASW
jgi:hypothetical protein